MSEAQLALSRIGSSHSDEEYGNRLDGFAGSTVRLPGRGMLVELHAPPASLQSLTAARLESMWQRAVPLDDCAGSGVLALHPEDLLVHLVLHLARREVFASGLRPLLDIALVLERWSESWDWARMRLDWQRCGIDFSMRVTLRFAHQLLGARVPQWVFDDDLPGLLAIEELASEQLWDGLSAQFAPGAINLALPIPWHGRVRRIMWRVSGYYWTRSGTVRRSSTDAIRQAWRRLLYDLEIRLPKLAGAARRGELRAAHIRRKIEISENKARLQQLLNASDRIAAMSESV